MNDYDRRAAELGKRVVAIVLGDEPEPPEGSVLAMMVRRTRERLAEISING